MRKKSLIVISIITMLLLANISILTKNVYAETKTGSEGTINWSYNNDTGELVFSGSGELTVDITGKAKEDIFDYYLENLKNIKSVKIEGDISSIGESAFNGWIAYGWDNLDCSFEDLTNIEISNSVTSIGEKAFISCKSLTNVEIPNSVTSIGIGAFYECESLTNIEVPGSVSDIGDAAFAYCTNLTNVEIQNGVTSIGDSMFAGCTSLTDVEIPNSVTSIGDSMFAGCTSLTNVEIPNSVTSIGNHAFEGCTSLTNVEIPNSVTSIGYYVFKGCTSLTNVEIPNGVTNIGDMAFEGCTSLTNVEIPNGVTSIGYRAFEECKGLTNVEIPNSVRNIGYETFKGCTSLTNVVIPNSVTDIWESSFYDCTSLSKIVITNKDMNFNGQGGICNEANNTIYCKSNSKAIEHAKTYNINYVIDDDGPTMNLTYDNQFINVEATDGEGAGLEKNAYSIEGENWQSDNKFKVEKDGKYTIYAKDLLGNIGKATITVDATKPEINSIKVDGTKITVEATDALSGLAENAYSLDGKNWQKENVFNVTKNGEYTIYVKDNSGNINTGKATVNVPEEKPAEDKTPEKTEEKPTEEPTEPAKEPEKEPEVEPAKETEKEPAKVEETKNDTKTANTAKNNNGETSPQTGDAIKIIAGVLIIASIGLVAIAIKKRKM